MKFGAIIAVVGVIVLILGFAVPTMQIEPARTVCPGCGSYTEYYNLTGSVSVSQSTYTPGVSIPLTFTWTSESNSPTAIWDIITSGGVTHVFSKQIGTQSGSYTYNWNGASAGTSYTFNVEYIHESVDFENIYNTIGQASFSVSGSSSSISIPTIETVSGTPNPITAGQIGTFNSNINWNGQTGTVTWEVNGNSIYGDQYVFNSVGTYTVTAQATNSAGTSYKSFNEVVNSANPTPTNTLPELKNVGSFYIVANGQTYNLGNVSNISITAPSYPVSITIYYVENHGITQNLSGISINVNSNTYILSLQNSTTYNGNTAYAMQVNLPAGSYVVTGYLQVASNPNSVQAFSIVVYNTQSAPPPVLIIHVDYMVIIIGIIMMIGGVILMRFGI